MKSIIAKAAEAFRKEQLPNDTDSFDFEVERNNRSPRFMAIVKAYSEGVPVDTIVDTHKCSRGTVMRYARLAGLPKRPKHFDPTLRAQAVELYRTGMGLKMIAELLDVSEAYVSTAAKEAGISRYKKVRND